MTSAQPVYDVVLLGGRVFDPASLSASTANLCIMEGRIAAILPESASFKTKVRIDVSDLLVTPGLIDLHVHSYPGETYWGINSDWPSLASGVATTVDAGSAGSANFDGLARILRNSQLNALAFVNIARTGLASPYGELLDADSLDVEGAVKVARAHPDLVVGFKLRASPNTVGGNFLECLAALRRAGDETGLPVMIHVSDGPPDLMTVLEHMRAGDVLTHCFTPYENGIVDVDGQPKPVVLEAVNRGVALDIGHGSGSFSFPAATAWRHNNLDLPIVSTDLHKQSSLGPAFSMSTVMTKLLTVGWSPEEVIAATTHEPATVLGRRCGLQVGEHADIAVLEITDQPITLWDSRGTEYKASSQFRCRLSIRRGALQYVSPETRSVQSA